jgi:hypothetical protein
MTVETCRARELKTKLSKIHRSSSVHGKTRPSSFPTKIGSALSQEERPATGRTACLRATNLAGMTRPSNENQPIAPSRIVAAAVSGGSPTLPKTTALTGKTIHPAANRTT